MVSVTGENEPVTLPIALTATQTAAMAPPISDALTAITTTSMIPTENSLSLPSSTLSLSSLLSSMAAPVTAEISAQTHLHALPALQHSPPFVAANSHLLAALPLIQQLLSPPLNLQPQEIAFLLSQQPPLAFSSMAANSITPISTPIAGANSTITHAPNLSSQSDTYHNYQAPNPTATFQNYIAANSNYHLNPSASSPAAAISSTAGGALPLNHPYSTLSQPPLPSVDPTVPSNFQQQALGSYINPNALHAACAAQSTAGGGDTFSSMQPTLPLSSLLTASAISPNSFSSSSILHQNPTFQTTFTPPIHPNSPTIQLSLRHHLMSCRHHIPPFRLLFLNLCRQN